MDLAERTRIAFDELLNAATTIDQVLIDSDACVARLMPDEMIAHEVHG